MGTVLRRALLFWEAILLFGRKWPPSRIVYSSGWKHNLTGWLCIVSSKTMSEKNQYWHVLADLDWSFYFGHLYQGFLWSLACAKWDALLANTIAILYFGSESILKQNRLYIHTKVHRLWSLRKLTESLFQTVLTTQNMKKMSKYFFLLVWALFLDGVWTENTYLLKTPNSFQMEAQLWSYGMQKIWFSFVRKNQKGWSEE